MRTATPLKKLKLSHVVTFVPVPVEHPNIKHEKTLNSTTKGNKQIVMAPKKNVS